MHWTKEAGLDPGQKGLNSRLHQYIYLLLYLPQATGCVLLVP